MSKTFASMTPEEMAERARAAFELAVEPGGGEFENAALAATGAVTAGLAAVLDRLERVILLLDERLPPARRIGPADPLEGTVEHHG